MSRGYTSRLRQLPVFSALPKRTLALADSLLTPVAFEDGDVLCAEGELGRQAFIIVSGSAVVSRGDEVLATVGPGDLVGELALLGDGRRTASVTAIEPVRAYVMSAQEFNSVRHLPGLDAEIRRVAAARSTSNDHSVAAA
jgi:CRP-like cAMP-binding protein